MSPSCFKPITASPVPWPVIGLGCTGKEILAGDTSWEVFWGLLVGKVPLIFQTSLLFAPNAGFPSILMLKSILLHVKTTFSSPIPLPVDGLRSRLGHCE